MILNARREEEEQGKPISHMETIKRRTHNEKLMIGVKKSIFFFAAEHLDNK